MNNFLHQVLIICVIVFVWGTLKFGFCIEVFIVSIGFYLMSVGVDKITKRVFRKKLKEIR